LPSYSNPQQPPTAIKPHQSAIPYEPSQQLCNGCKEQTHACIISAPMPYSAPLINLSTNPKTQVGQSLTYIPVHVGPAEAFNLFPKTATSQAARDKLNKKTDELPSVAQAGKELVGGSDPIGANSPKDVGKAVDKYALTSAGDLTKSSCV